MSCLFPLSHPPPPTPARYSVSVFQPPFQAGRMSPEQSLQSQLPDKQEPPARSSCATVVSAAAASATSTTMESGDGARASHLPQEPQAFLSAPELQPELGDSGAVRSKVSAGRSSLLSLDSGFSEPPLDARAEGCVEKEIPFERTSKPEGQ